MSRKRRLRPAPPGWTTGPRIKALREARGWSQEQLATALSVHATAVSHWETCDDRPGAEKLPAIAELFNTTISALIEGDAGFKALSHAIEAAAS